jgi:hypothetical protein
MKTVAAKRNGSQKIEVQLEGHREDSREVNSLQSSDDGTITFSKVTSTFNASSVDLNCIGSTSPADQKPTKPPCKLIEEKHAVGRIGHGSWRTCSSTIGLW